MPHKFFGRETELEVLNRLWTSSKEEFLILYGRRRVGKTALLAEWMRRTDNRALYWVASPTSAAAQLRSFSHSIYNLENPGLTAPDNFTYASWEQVFQQVARLAKDERLALFIDEFTYLLEVDPGIAGLLQNLWDHVLKETNIFLCLSGSHLGMMKREFFSYQAPLYGRASAQIHLQPFHFGSTRSFFPNYSAVDRVALYSIFGGVPAYWEQVDPSKSISWNIKKHLLTSSNLLQSEPRLLLQDFISDPHNYLSILAAIANGAHILREIADISGLPSGHVSKYLGVLAETGFVERRVPVTKPGPSRAGRYHITDPYLRFYFRFLADRQDQLALGAQDIALAEITRHMIDFIGRYTWEELCREWVLRAGALSELPVMPDQVGSAWNSKVQIDVVGINPMEKTLILGECKWTLSSNERKVMAELVEDRAAKIIPARGKWRVCFLGFSRSGWTSGALGYQKEINQHPVQGENWVSTGMQLITLDGLDDDLTRWTK
ncbi:MAG TPA: ATP-binding protein [Anaerolineales bacterium]|nr:ATP-binding protein [Anaerolineales bacterium]